MAPSGGDKLRRIFLLSPASCDGERARLIFNEQAKFELAGLIRSPQGAPLGEVFSFLSGLYFRGKMAYAHAFARPPDGIPGILIITANAGLRTLDEPIDLKTLRRFATVPIDPKESRYRQPLLRDARELAAKIRGACEFILLGSVASGKYVEPLSTVLGKRLLIPAEFIGRGDMSRGGLMLRCVKEGRELEYICARPVLNRSACAGSTRR